MCGVHLPHALGSPLSPQTISSFYFLSNIGCQTCPIFVLC